MYGGTSNHVTTLVGGSVAANSATKAEVPVSVNAVNVNVNNLLANDQHVDGSKSEISGNSDSKTPEQKVTYSSSFSFTSSSIDSTMLTSQSSPDKTDLKPTDGTTSLHNIVATTSQTSAMTSAHSASASASKNEKTEKAPQSDKGVGASPETLVPIRNSLLAESLSHPQNQQPQRSLDNAVLNSQAFKDNFGTLANAAEYRSKTLKFINDYNMNVYQVTLSIKCMV